MNKWTPLAPSKPGPSTPSRFNVLKPSKPPTRPQGPCIGRFPEIVVLNIVSFLPIPDLPNLARGCKALARLVRDERGWESKCKVLGLAKAETEARSPAPRQTPRLSTSLKNRPSISRADDDFGDFSTDTFEDVDFGDFSTPTKSKAKGSLIDFDELPLPSRAGAGGKQSGFFALTPPSSSHLAKFSPGPWYTSYRDHHLSLVPLCRHLQSSPSPSSTLALLFPPPSTMTSQSQTLLQLLLFLSPSLQPLRDWGFLRQALLAASDRFDSTCLVAFEMADSKGDTDAMRNAAQASWSVWVAGSGSRDQWECGRVWVEKREVFYETSKWDPLENIVYVKYLPR